MCKVLRHLPGTLSQARQGPCPCGRCDCKFMPEFRSGLNQVWVDFMSLMLSTSCSVFFPLAGEMLSYGDRQEVEIRGCSLWCVELIRDCLLELIEKKGEKTSGEINSVLLDYYLWDYARDHREDMKGIPFHHTRCIYYWSKVQTDPKKTCIFVSHKHLYSFALIVRECSRRHSNKERDYPVSFKNCLLTYRSVSPTLSFVCLLTFD